MTPGWPFDLLLETPIEDIEATIVTCATCPVSMSCAVNAHGTGYRMDCCGATGVEHDDILYVVDCMRNTFAKHLQSNDVIRCPLCAGDVIKSALIGAHEKSRYIPTAYAAVPLRMRLKVFKAMVPDAIQLKADVARVTET